MQEKLITRKKIKVFIFLAVFLVGVNLLLSTLFHLSKTSFYTYQSKYKLVSDSEAIVFVDELSNELEVVVIDSKPNEISFATKWEIHYMDTATKVDSSDFQNKGFRVTRLDGEEYVEKLEIYPKRGDKGIEILRTHDKLNLLDPELQRVYGVDECMKYVKHQKSSFYKFVALAIFSIIGALLIVLPEVAWRLERKLFRKKEITEVAVAINVLLGLGILVLNLAMNIIAFL